MVGAEKIIGASAPEPPGFYIYVGLGCW